MPKKISEAENKNEKQVKAPVKAEVPLQKRMATEAEQMKAHLESQPKVSILIPFEKGEKKGASQPFCINGYRFTVPKGVMTQVPEQVAEMIAERFNVELEIRGKSLGQQPQKTQDALG
jgi:hypothetical protein